MHKLLSRVSLLLFFLAFHQRKVLELLKVALRVLTLLLQLLIVIGNERVFQHLHYLDARRAVLLEQSLDQVDRLW